MTAGQTGHGRASIRGALPLAALAWLAAVPLGLAPGLGTAITAELGLGAWASAAAIGLYALGALAALVAIWKFPPADPATPLRTGTQIAASGALLLCIASFEGVTPLLGVSGLIAIGSGLVAVFPLALSVAARAARATGAPLRTFTAITGAHVVAVVGGSPLLMLAGLVVSPILAGGLLTGACSVVVGIYGPRTFARSPGPRPTAT